MAHLCHFPGCGKPCPPAMWGCKPCWFKLPKDLRDKIWMTYVPGQEITKTPSAAYLAAAEEVQRWIRKDRPIATAMLDLAGVFEETLREGKWSKLTSDQVLEGVIATLRHVAKESPE